MLDVISLCRVLVMLALVVCGALPTTALAVDVEVRSNNRYFWSARNDETFPVQAQVGDEASVEIAPGGFILRSHRAARRNPRLVVWAAAEDVARTREQWVEQREEKVQRFEQLDEERATWLQTVGVRRQRAVDDAIEIITNIVVWMPIAACLPQLVLSFETREFVPFLLCVADGGTLPPLLGPVMEVAWRAAWKAIDTETKMPDFDGLAVRLPSEIEELDARVASLAFDSEAADDARLWEQEIDLSTLERPKGDVTPYSTLSFSVAPMAIVPSPDWFGMGRFAYSIEVAGPLTPELYGGGRDVAVLFRFMATGSYDVTSMSAVDGGATGSWRLTWEVLSFGAQIRTTIHPYAFIDLGAGLELPLGSVQDYRFDGETTGQRRGVIAFERWGDHLGRKVWARARVGFSLNPRRGLGHHAAGPALVVDVRVRQLPSGVGRTVAPYPEEGLVYVQPFVGISVSL